MALFGLCHSSGADLHSQSKTLLWECIACRDGQFQTDRTLLEKHEFVFWKGTLTLRKKGVRELSAVSRQKFVSSTNEFEASLGVNS